MTGAVIKANGPSILRIGFDPQKFRSLSQSEQDHVVYHLTRLLSGEASAVLEWDHLGMKVDVVPWKAQ
jgi:hypothetical protein